MLFALSLTAVLVAAPAAPASDAGQPPVSLFSFDAGPSDGIRLRPGAGTSRPFRATGPVTHLRATESGHYAFRVDGGAEVLLQLPAAIPPPFRMGDHLQVSLLEGGGWHRLWYGSVLDGSGVLLVATSVGQSPPLPFGWAVLRGGLQRTVDSAAHTQQQYFTLVKQGTATATAKVPSESWFAFDGERGARYLAWANAVQREWKGPPPPDSVGGWHDWALLRLPALPRRPD